MLLSDIRILRPFYLKLRKDKKMRPSDLNHWGAKWEKLLQIFPSAAATKKAALIEPGVIPYICQSSGLIGFSRNVPSDLMYVKIIDSKIRSYRKVIIVSSV